MKDLEIDENIENTLRKAFKPAPLSTEYRNKLLQELITEVDYIYIIRASKDHFWEKPELWVAVATAIILAVIGYGVWLPYSVLEKLTS